MKMTKSVDAPGSGNLPPLVTTTAKNFKMVEVSADEGYSDRRCHNPFAEVGVTPYISHKKNTTGDVGGLFKKMFHYFQFKRGEFLAHYHRRSNVESTVMMIKSKFGDAVRSKTEVAARNELLCKVLCHDICGVISAIYELGIVPILTGEVAHKPGQMPNKPLIFVRFMGKAQYLPFEPPARPYMPFSPLRASELQSRGHKRPALFPESRLPAAPWGTLLTTSL